MEFGYFACDTRRAVAKNFVRVNQGFFYPVRCFVENDSAVLNAEPLKRAAPFAANAHTVYVTGMYSRIWCSVQNETNERDVGGLSLGFPAIVW